MVGERGGVGVLVWCIVYWVSGGEYCLPLVVGLVMGMRAGSGVEWVRTYSVVGSVKCESGIDIVVFLTSFSGSFSMIEGCPKRDGLSRRRESGRDMDDISAECARSLKSGVM